MVWGCSIGGKEALKVSSWCISDFAFHFLVMVKLERKYESFLQ